MPKFREMDTNVPLRQQLEADNAGPVVLINTFTVDPAEADQFMAAWSADAAIMKRQPGFISTQLHRGIAGSSVFLNYAVWESTALFKRAFSNPEFQAKLGDYPPSAAASPHLFRKLAVSGICVE
jgi:heme-degrading monooxygenase HmoA